MWLSVTAQAQINDNFSDGDFTTAPAWTGDAGKYEVDAAQQLHLNAPAVTDTGYLSTPQTLLGTTEWHFNVRMDFAPSATNYAKVYLVSDNANPKLPLNGYYIKVGGVTGSVDAVELYRQNATASTLLISGDPGHAATNPNLAIKVLRDAAGLWSLYVDTLGGEEYVLEGTATDNSITTSSYFALESFYTSTRSTLFWYDNIYVGAPIIDNIAPQVVAITPINPYQTDVLFDETVTLTTSQALGNYFINTIGSPVSAVRDATDSKIVHLLFSSPFANGTTYVLQINNVSDNAGNLMVGYEYSFSFYLPTEYDVLIDEIFADPSPVVGLPAYEYIELYNTTGSDILLNAWSIKDPSTTAVLGNITLPAHSYITICDLDNISAFTSIPNVYGLNNFPSLNNSSDTLWLNNNQGTTIHYIAYSDAWYENSIKKDGGWSLEMKDTESPCLGSKNWSASNHISGGTPSAINSIAQALNDTTAPALVKVYPIDNNTLQLTFDKALNIASANDASRYSIDNGIGIPASASVQMPDKKNVILELGSVITTGVIYEVVVNNLQDCNLNTIGVYDRLKFAIPESPTAGDVYINEILSNPKSGGVDYVELYNASAKTFDLKSMYITEKDVTTGSILTSTTIAPEGYLLMPSEYVCITSDATIVKSQYYTSAPTHFVENPSMPNYDDNEGMLSIADNSGATIDMLHYNADWHNALLTSVDGVSLEKLNPSLTTQNADSWKSATENVGFGTPAYQNSQMLQVVLGSDIISVNPEVITPNQDGMQDVAMIQYTLDKTDFQGTIIVYDALGRKVKTLLENSSLGQSGFTTWDGLNDKDETVLIGQYIVLLDYYNLDGKHQKALKTIVVR